MDELTLTPELKVNEWNYILEVLDLCQHQQIKSVAIGLLKPKLDKDFEEKNITISDKI